MIWLVCGGRNFCEIDVIDRTLTSMLLDTADKVTHLINGVAPGTDSIARSWAVKRGIQPVDCPALWETYPRRGPKNAGTRRNTAMLELKPHRVIAFPGGTGTADMINQTKAAIRAGCAHPYHLILVSQTGVYNTWKP